MSNVRQHDESMGLPAWLTLARALEKSGETARALSVLEEHAAAGEIRALVELAHVHWKNGRFHEAGEFMADAERIVRPDDWDAHFALHLAFAIGVAHGDYEEKQRKAFAHLLIAARGSGDPRMKLSVASHHWGGLNCVAEDWAAAERWLCEAAQSGIPDIVATYKKLQRARRRVSRGVA